MAPINPQLNLNLAPAVVFTNRGFRNSEEYSRYLRSYRDHPLQCSFIIPSATFHRYRLDITGFVDGLGWSSLLKDWWYDQCPEAVRMFYTNMKCGPGCNPTYFTTTVYNYCVTVTADLLATLLSLPKDGYSAGNIEEFDSHGFNTLDTLAYLVHDTGCYYSSMFSVERLPNDLKVLQFYITHIFLPRDLDTVNILEDSDLWILLNAKLCCPISYAPLMFNHMIKYWDDNYSGKLPFGPEITTLLRALGIDLRDKIIISDILDDLHAQHVFRRTVTNLGPQKLVKGPGGEKDKVAATRYGQDDAAQGESDTEPEPEEPNNEDNEVWLEDTAAALAADAIAKINKGKQVVESSGKRKVSPNLEYFRERMKLEREGNGSNTLGCGVMPNDNGASSSVKLPKEANPFYLLSDDEEDDPSKYLTSPEYSY